MPFCDPSNIIVEKRFRESLPDLEQLAEDIKNCGQLQPILVKEEGGQMILVTGERRLEACKRLNRQVWWVSQKSAQGNLNMESPLQLRRMELMENLSRCAFTPVEEAKAIAEIDRIMKEAHGAKTSGPKMGDAPPGWSYEQTANLLGFASKGSVSRAVKIAELADAVPDINDAESISEAEKMLAREIQRAARAELLKRAQSRAEVAAQVEVGAEAKEPQSLSDWVDEKILVGDAVDLFKTLKDESVGIIVADPPYNLDAFSRMVKGGYAENMTEFDDTGFDPSQIYPEMARVLKNKGWLFLFGSFDQFFPNRDALLQQGLQVFEIPLIWVKGQSLEAINPSYNPQPFAWPSSAAEIILMAKKGTPSVTRHRHNIIVCQKVHGKDKSHASQKPVELIKYLIEWVHISLLDDLLLDPFCGSGSSLLAAAQFPKLDYLGFEKNPDTAQLAKENLLAAKITVQNLNE